MNYIRIFREKRKKRKIKLKQREKKREKEGACATGAHLATESFYRAFSVSTTSERGQPNSDDEIVPHVTCDLECRL